LTMTHKYWFSKLSSCIYNVATNLWCTSISQQLNHITIKINTTSETLTYFPDNLKKQVFSYKVKSEETVQLSLEFLLHILHFICVM
jgi:hypothetical protein